MSSLGLTQLGGIVHAGVAFTPSNENSHLGYFRGNVDFGSPGEQ
jgi:hypothetical protein